MASYHMGTMMNIKFKLNNSNAKLPSKAHEGDAAFDLYSCQEIILEPGETKAVGTGLVLAEVEFSNNLDKSYFIKIEGRSGLALKRIVPTGGIVDLSYRNEIKCIMNNNSTVPFKISIGDRIAQMIVYRVAANSAEISLSTTETVTKTSRGQSGFGSTGMQ